MSNKSRMNVLDIGYSDGYLQMIFGKKRKEQKAKRKRERQNKKGGRK